MHTLTPGSLGGLRVLLVDDNVDAVESFKYLLEFEGAEVQVASSAPDALASLTAAPVDLIISDLSMPGMDGFAFMTEVRRRPAGRKTLAISLSGMGRQQDAERALRAGFSTHLTKPVSIDVLRDTITRLRT